MVRRVSVAAVVIEGTCLMVVSSHVIVDENEQRWGRPSTRKKRES